ncbi:thioether cross-link-forming SCIFF peptide maturase [Alkalibacter rhizosphaerae]|uniref:Thioether cross-link-forming SCIFF peptide maturase n=1 Tax=Alkalibacter rhizosphaerae TaxID=2815577 RepID=A0A975AHM5_9FIRM|nr:thioether cross-link-forming SCIFF peptide maturase [Alkalibacter rhizosphaerae]QSX08779.1 thioether cross-link-forming SCIFF peptide maturase [Alkalibacter rhizosphaerae]
MIHKYTLNGYHILLDVNSGSVFEIDPITDDLLEYYPNWEEAISSLQDKYPVEEMKESWKELEFLEEQGLLNSPEIVLEDKVTTDHPIKAMCLHVSHDCNMRCAYCFASEGSFHGEKVLMELETGKKAFDFLIENSGNRRHLEVDFFGGEPLMNLDVVKALVEYGRSKEEEFGKEFRFTMTTNALLLNEENMAYLNENMSNIVLSLDGRKETNDRMRKTVNMDGTYQYIIDKIKRMTEIRGDKDHYVRGTFTRNNMDFSKDVLDLADQGFKSISVEPVVASPEEPYALREEDVELLLQEYEDLAAAYLKSREEGKDFQFFHFNIDLAGGPCAYKRVSGCGAGTDYISITPTGQIYPCHQFVGLEEFILGDLEQGIVAETIRKDFEKVNLADKPACKDCWAKYYCGGGCFANAYNFNKDIAVPYELGCILEKKRVECAIMIKIALQDRN